MRYPISEQEYRELEGFNGMGNGVSPQEEPSRALEKAALLLFNSFREMIAGSMEVFSKDLRAQPWHKEEFLFLFMATPALAAWEAQLKSREDKLLYLDALDRVIDSLQEHFQNVCEEIA